MACFMTAILISCQKDMPEPGRETGSLHLDIGMSMSIHEVSCKFKSIPETDDFRVTVYKADGAVVMAFDSASAIPDTIELETGNYYAEAHSDNDLPAAFENPYYSGVSDIFTINSNSQQSVLVNCTLANTMVSVGYTDNVRDGFTDYSTTVSSELDSLVFSKDETRTGYFRTLPLEIRVELSYRLPGGSDSVKFLSGQIPAPLPNRHYEILVDASVNAGMASFQVLLDSSAAPVELIEITDQPIPPQNGEIGYGELLITEIMYNPTALSDSEGEWFEIRNNSDHPVNLKNLVLGRDDADLHIITDSIVLSPDEFFVFERSQQATDAAGAWVYGPDIQLPNAGAVLSVYNEGTETVPGALIFSVNYGGAGFPDGAGASISLDPDMLDADNAVQGTSWCLSTSVYSTGDCGTPGAVNDACP